MCYINSITSLKLYNLESFSSYIFDLNTNYLESIIGIQISDNGYGTYYYKPNNTAFQSMNITVETSKITDFSISGLIDINFNDLCKKFGKYREAYSHYDDLYFYFFNEYEHTFKVICRFDKQIGKMDKFENLKYIWIKK